jgi:AP-1 complex subunit beta-1
VRRAVRAIGRCAIKLDKATERCINVLLDLIKTKVSYVVQEAVVVIKDIFRKYPNRYEGIIATLCENLEDLDEPEAKASMVWIIGEYAERIDNADELLEIFLETFADETSAVQLQLLTATVKLFLKQPENTQEMVQKVLNLATEHSDNPDLRDRGYIYWRLLSSDPEAARAVVLATKPEIGDDTCVIEPALLDDLIGQISTLSSIYHKPAEAFVMRSLQMGGATEEEEEEEDGEGNATSADTESEDLHSAAPSYSTPQKGKGAAASANLLDLLDDTPPPAPAHAPQASHPPSAPSGVKKVQIVTAEAGKGIFIAAAMVKRNGQVVLELDVGNALAAPVQQLAIQLNKNAFGLAPLNPQINLSSPIANNSVCSYSLGLTVNPAMVNPADTAMTLQAAIKNITTNSVFYFVVPIEMDAVFSSGSAMDVTAFATTWKSMDESAETSVVIKDLPSIDQEVIKAKLVAKDVAFIVARDIPGQEGQRAAYYLAKAAGTALFVELKFKAGMNVCKITVKSANKAMSDHTKMAVAKVLMQ